MPLPSQASSLFASLKGVSVVSVRAGHDSMSAGQGQMVLGRWLRYAFNRSAYPLRSFASLGGMTARQ